MPALRLMVWLALHAGRKVTRLLLVLVCLYFVVVSPKSSSASVEYLDRVLGRRPGWADRFRHFHSFAACLLDRVFLLNNRLDLFEFTFHGEEMLRAHLARGSGCLLFGAHFGSFEAVRAAGRQCHDLPISLVMYEKNATKTNAVLHAINPSLALEIIGLGKPGAMLAVKNRLDQAHLVGVLADRGLTGDRMIDLPFLGELAPFPVGPFRMAALLRQPVVMMLGVYRGGRRYHIHFEEIGTQADFEIGDIDETIMVILQRYVGHLEQHCRLAPYNWSNFFPFWKRK